MITRAGVFREKLAGRDCAFLLTNAEIARWEDLHDAGIYTFWDALNGRATGPKVGQVRDLLALALVGGGMADDAADALIDALPPSETLRLRTVAQMVLAVTFMPELLTRKPDTKKKRCEASGGPAVAPTTTDDMTPDEKFPTSAA